MDKAELSFSMSHQEIWSVTQIMSLCEESEFVTVNLRCKMCSQRLFHIGASISLVNNGSSTMHTLKYASSRCSTIHSQDLEHVANGCLESCTTYSEESN